MLIVPSSTLFEAQGSQQSRELLKVLARCLTHDGEPANHANQCDTGGRNHKGSQRIVPVRSIHNPFDAFAAAVPACPSCPLRFRPLARVRLPGLQELHDFLWIGASCRLELAATVENTSFAVEHRQ